MVDDLEGPAQLAVLVGDRVEAMRAGRHDRALGHPVAIERLDVARREDLVDVLVAHPPGRVAGARLLLAEDGERTPGRVQAAGERPGNLPIALVEGRRAADPVEDLDLARACRPRPGRPRSAPRSRGPSSSPSGSRAAGPRDCRPSPCSGRRRSARSGSANPRGRGCAGSRRSCRRARSGPGRPRRTPRRSRSPRPRRRGSRRRRSRSPGGSGWASRRRGRLGRAGSASSGSGRGRCSASTAMWRRPMIISRGLSGLPVRFAGQASVHRPHSVHVNPSRRSFQPRSWRVRRPNVASSASRSIAGSSPRGASLRK